jgi:hypothetical protein
MLADAIDAFRMAFTINGIVFVLMTVSIFNEEELLLLHHIK